jgi:glycosyltransferase involved in cell wall biosynthesis
MVNTTTKIVWICELPSHYNDFLFNELHKNNILEVYYMKISLSSHPWKTTVDRKYDLRQYNKVLGMDFNLIVKSFDPKSVFIIGGWFDLTAIAIIFVRLLLGYKYIIWTDTPNMSKPRNNYFSFLRNFIIKKIFNNARYILGTGKMALKHLKSMGAQEDKLVDFPYYVDCNLFSPPNLSSVEKNYNYTFLSSGRLINSQKGYNVSIKAFAKVVIKYPELPLKYLIAGTGPDLKILTCLVESLGISNKVHFLGWLEPHSLPDFYKSGLFFLHPAFFEPYGVAVLEAMASANIVIGSNQTGAIIDRINNGFNGFIHETGNENQIYNTICSLLEDQVFSSKISVESRKTALSAPIQSALDKINKLI